MRHPTYKHLEDRLRLGPLSVSQWAQVFVAGTAAAVFGGYLSPFGIGPTIFISIVGAGWPVALSYGAMGLEFSVGQFAIAAWRYWREPRSFTPGRGEATSGYVLSSTRPQGPRPSVSMKEPVWDA